MLEGRKESRRLGLGRRKQPKTRKRPTYVRTGRKPKAQ